MSRRNKQKPSGAPTDKGTPRGRVGSPSEGGRWMRSSGSLVAWWLAVAAVAAWVVVAFLGMRQDGYGFTALLDFGDPRFGLRRLPDLDAVPVYNHEGVPGYDGQYYAQLALRPAGTDPALVRTIDNPPYRARRMLMPWIAWLLGGGNTWWVLNAQAVLNLVTWAALGALLLRWLRPGSWGDLVKWCAVMISAGMLSSLRHSLTDGPALFALAGTMALTESRLGGLAVVGAALAALTRETSVLVAGAWWPTNWRDARGWLRAAVMGALAVVPLGLWMLHLRGLWHNGAHDGSGVDNFTWPLAGFFERWRLLVGEYWEGARGWNTVGAILVHLGITVQAVWIAVRPRWSSLWWRIGALHVVLLSLLNTQVWEGYPGASPRVLLPLMLAFNLLVPARRWGLVLLVAGNLGVVAGILEMQPLVRPTWRIEGAPSAVVDPISGQRMAVRFSDGFYQPESWREHAWRWCDGEGKVEISNPRADAVLADVAFSLQTVQPQRLEVRVQGQLAWLGTVGHELEPIQLRDLEIPTGGLDVEIRAAESGTPVPGDARHLAFAVYDLRVVVR